MSPHTLSFVAAVLFSSMVVVQAHAVEETPSLTAEDKQYLDGLMREFLFDPEGAERVAVKTVARTVRATVEEITAEGWLVAGKDGKPGRVFSIDGALIPLPPNEEMRKVDFQTACGARYSDSAKKKNEKEDRDEFSQQRQRTKIGEVTADDLAFAAWLYRLGDEALSARALAAARAGKVDPRIRLREELAWSAFARMVQAYMVRADEEALAHGERLQRLYAAEAKEYPQAPWIIEELKRRQKKGTFGKARRRSGPTVSTSGTPRKRQPT